MASTIILSDNGASSGSAGLKQTAGNDGVLILQTTTSGGTATTAVTADNLQNVGFGGVTPNTWQSTRKAIQVGDTSALAYGGNQTTVGNNFFINSSGINSYIKASTYAHIYIQGSDGSHEWYTAPNTGTAGGSASFTRLLAVNTGYSLALQGANSQTGTGITFPAVQNASSNGKTLDDYEEGTWSSATVGFGTVTLNNGRYTKIGRLVTISGYLSNFSDRSTASAIIVNGLPFTPLSLENMGACMNQYVNILNATCYVSSNGLSFYETKTSAGFANVLHSNLTSASSQFYFEVTYLTAT